MAVTVLAAGPGRAGEAEIFVLQGGERAPLPGVRISGGGDPVETDPYGHASLETSGGSLDLKLSGGGVLVSEVAVSVQTAAEGRTTIVIAIPDPQNPKAGLETFPPLTAGGETSHGTINVAVTDAVTSDLLGGTRVVVAGVELNAMTGDDGTKLLTLRPGTYTVLAIMPMYGSSITRNVVVKDSEATPLNLKLRLSDEATGGSEVSVVRSISGVQALLDERRNDATIVDSVGAAQIAKAGDSDTAAALKRVTGLSVVGGKYVYVRGMGERYSSATLNGSTLPSTEPERRVVPLDLFPAGLVETLVVQKSFTPDSPGEFGGGSVKITSKGIPARPFWQVSLGSGLRSGTTFQEGLTYDGGGTDWLGVDDGTRELPGAVDAASGKRIDSGNYTDSQLEAYGESMQNVWTPKLRTIGPDFSFSTAGGAPFKLGGAEAGFSATLTYGNDAENREMDYRVYRRAGSELASRVDYDFETLTRRVDAGLLLAFGVNPAEGHRLRFSSMNVRSTEDEARVYQGRNDDPSTDIRVTRLRWVENMMLSQTLSGNHIFPAAKFLVLDWRYTYSLALRDEPDRREIRYDWDPGVGAWLYSDDTISSQRLFSDLTDHHHDAGISLALPFKSRSSMDSLVKFGGGAIQRDREVDTRRFRFVNVGSRTKTDAIRRLPPEQLFAPENIGPDGFVFTEITRETDNYEADQTITSGFAQVEVPVHDQVTLFGGVRVESSTQEVRTFELFNPFGYEVGTELEDLAVLPSFILTYRFKPGHQIRFGYGRTVARPDFRELSEAPYDDVTGGRQIIGNPNLDVTHIDHFDVRWEWYPDEGDMVSFGLFYKNFSKPIEFTVLASAQESLTYVNAEGASNAGAEFEARATLDEFGEGWENVYVATNLSFIYSRIRLGEDAGGVQTNDERPLQGQSPYVANLMLGYSRETWGTDLSLVYNVTGKRIAEVGAQSIPDMYEQPFHQLDVVCKQRLHRRVSLSFQAKNLLDSRAQFTQSDEVARSWRQGRLFKLGLTVEIF